MTAARDFRDRSAHAHLIASAAMAAEGTGHTVPIDFVRAAVASARERSHPIDDWLRSAGISPMLLDGPRARVTVDQMTALVRALWEATDDELFGRGPAPVPRGTFRLLSFGLINAPDLGAAIGRLADFSTVLPGVPPFTVITGPEHTRIEIDTSVVDDSANLVTDLLLSVGHRFAGWLIGRRIVLREVALPYPEPASTADLDKVFGAPLRFDAPVAAITIDSAVLGSPIVQDDDTLTAYIRNAPADVLARRDYGSTLADRVRRILQRGIGGEWPTSAAIAARLAMSEQHMRRTLAEEGTSMSAIRDELLRDEAIASLVAGQETVTALSARLGFSEPSAFHRAFRRWTGSAVSVYRGR